MKEIWLIRPGTASVFTPILGIVQAWITSEDVDNILIIVFVGKTRELSVFNNRGSLFSSFVMYLEKSIGGKLLYSYVQYHWCPVDLIVRCELIVLSNIYRVFRDGTAVNTIINMGKIVQIVSIISFFIYFELWNGFFTEKINNIEIIIVIKIKYIKI